eukprot:m.1165740 g.1165740  ORF g.1165740 m.1165740 type:complete len:54 (-) comp24503_c0_seq11:115-276(-)
MRRNILGCFGWVICTGVRIEGVEEFNLLEVVESSAGVREDRNGVSIVRGIVIA